MLLLSAVHQWQGPGSNKPPPMMTEPTFPGCVIECRPVGMLKMLDRGQSDDKILAVPSNDPQFSDYHDLSDIPRHFPTEVEHFFQVYKDLESGQTNTRGFANRSEAQAVIAGARERFERTAARG